MRFTASSGKLTNDTIPLCRVLTKPASCHLPSITTARLPSRIYGQASWLRLANVTGLCFARNRLRGPYQLYEKVSQRCNPHLLLCCVYTPRSPLPTPGAAKTNGVSPPTPPRSEKPTPIRTQAPLTWTKLAAYLLLWGRRLLGS